MGVWKVMTGLARTVDAMKLVNSVRLRKTPVARRMAHRSGGGFASSISVRST